MKKNIVAVSALVPGNRRVYVKATSKREADSLLQVTTTFNINEAKDFGTIPHAKIGITQLYNPFDRLFIAEKATVTRPEVINDMSDIN